MSAMGNMVGMLVLVGAVVGVAVYLKARAGGVSSEGEAPKFKAKALLTANELEFLNRLEQAVPELRFHAQVAMGAILDPAVSRKEGKEYFKIRGMFAQKMIDFVAQNKVDGSIVAIIELDDKTHDSEKDSKRDAMLHSAGYKTIRWHSKNKPESGAIRSALLGK